MIGQTINWPCRCLLLSLAVAKEIPTVSLIADAKLGRYRPVLVRITQIDCSTGTFRVTPSRSVGTDTKRRYRFGCGSCGTDCHLGTLLSHVKPVPIEVACRHGHP